MTEPAQMTMADAAAKATVFLNMFKGVQHLAVIIQAAALAENVVAERTAQAAKLSASNDAAIAAISKMQSECLALRENAEAYAKDRKHEGERDFAKAKEAADKLLRDTEAAISNALAISSANLEKREAELAALTEMTNAKASEIAALDARITAARDAMRKLLG